MEGDSATTSRDVFPSGFPRGSQFGQNINSRSSLCLNSWTSSKKVIRAQVFLHIFNKPAGVPIVCTSGTIYRPRPEESCMPIFPYAEFKTFSYVISRKYEGAKKGYVKTIGKCTMQV